MVADARAVLDTVVQRFAANPGRAAKGALHHVTEALGPTDWVTGPGDDAAVLPRARGKLLAAGEALYPPFVSRDPFGAGIGAVLANVNDIAAMGGRPLGIIDTIVASAPIARSILAGLRHASELYDVPIVGGHLTVSEAEPSLSAFIVGEVTSPLLTRNVAPGQPLLVAACLDGRLREDFPFFPSFEQRAGRMRGDVELLARLAERGCCVAAKDVSMAGTLGSLAMLLEPTGTGVVVDLDRLPRPQDVALETWLDVFPAFAFLLCAAPGRSEECIVAFEERGLVCRQVGTIDDLGTLRVRLDGHETALMHQTRRATTGLASSDSLGDSGASRGGSDGQPA
ncbi:MAG: AIR synthase related protein [Egibacteraceae bacterium]